MTAHLFSPFCIFYVKYIKLDSFACAGFGYLHGIESHSPNKERYVYKVHTVVYYMPCNARERLRNVDKITRGWREEGSSDQSNMCVHENPKKAEKEQMKSTTPELISP